MFRLITQPIATTKRQRFERAEIKIAYRNFVVTPPRNEFTSES
jgi:hypothetical protein